jgi:hypothetical protein
LKKRIIRGKKTLQAQPTKEPQEKNLGEPLAVIMQTLDKP